jgi:hypothetical protein
VRLPAQLRADAGCPPIKAHQCGNQAIKLRGLKALLKQDTVERPPIIEEEDDNQRCRAGILNDDTLETAAAGVLDREAHAEVESEADKNCRVEKSRYGKRTGFFSL